MSGYTRKSKKQPVARRATPEQQVKLSPPPEALKSLVSAKSVLSERHKVLSWDVIAYELGIKDRGTLSRVANSKREASAKLIDKLNRAYGCHLHVKTIKANIPVCPMCDQPYEPKHRCKNAPKSTRQPDPVVRVKRVDAARIAVLSALYSSSGIGESMYRLALRRNLDAVMG